MKPRPGMLWASQTHPGDSSVPRTPDELIRQVMENPRKLAGYSHGGLFCHDCCELP